MMRAILLTAFSLFVVIAGCSKDKDSGSSAGKGKTGTDEPVKIRRKIEKLTPKTYVQVTIDLFREQKKWAREIQEFMKKKRQNFYRSFGLSEKKYIDFINSNQESIRNYLKRNPHLNQEMNRFRSMYTQ